jgi:hypothetical protein
MYGADGVSCGTCQPGQGLNSLRTRCLYCDLGKYSYDGVVCKECDLGFEVNDDQTGCDECGWGKYSRDGFRCEVCLPGQEPAYEEFESQATGCQPCLPGYFSQAGLACLLCWSNSHSLTNNTYCLCSSGYKFLPDVEQCIDIDECSLFDRVNGGCDPLVPCDNTLGGRNCGKCPVGFTGDGYRGCSSPAVNHAGGEVSMAPEVPLTLAADPNVLEVGSTEQRVYVAKLIKHLSETMGVPENQIEITSLSRGNSTRRMQDEVAHRQLYEQLYINSDHAPVNVVAKFKIKHPDAPALLEKLNLQLADPTSAIFTGPSAVEVVTGQHFVYEMVCPAGSFLNQVAEKCSACPLGMEPNAVQDGCRACATDEASDGRHCVPCLHGHEPNIEHAACVACGPRQASLDGSRCKNCASNLVPTLDGRGCECPAGMYDVRQHALNCHEPDPSWGAYTQPPDPSSTPYCGKCPPCFDCATRGSPPLLNAEYGLRSKASVAYASPADNGTRDGIRCRFAGACLAERRDIHQPRVGQLVELLVPLHGNASTLAAGAHVWVRRVHLPMDPTTEHAVMELDPYHEEPALACNDVHTLLLIHAAAEARYLAGDVDGSHIRLVEQQPPLRYAIEADVCSDMAYLQRLPVPNLPVFEITGFRCAGGYSGPICAVCDDGWARTDAGCIDCGAKGAVWPMWAGLFGAFVGLTWFWKNVLAPLARQKAVDAGPFRPLGLPAKVKIAVGLFQVLSQLALTINLPLPAGLDAFFDRLRVLYGDIFDTGLFEDARSLDCVVRTTVYLRFLWTMLLPLWVCAANFYLPRVYRKLTTPCRAKHIAASYQEDLQLKVEAQQGEVQAYNNAMNRSVAAVLLLHPLLCASIVRMFRCRSLGDGESWHEEDFSIECTSGDYSVVSLAAALLLSVYPLGIPLFFTFMLVNNRTRLTYVGPESDRPRSKKIFPKYMDGDKEMYGILVADYRESFYLFEIVEMVRKFVFCSLLLLVDRGSARQTFVACVFAFLCFALQMLLRPYRANVDNSLKAAAEAQLCCTLLGCLVLRLDVSDAAGYDAVLVALNILVFPLPLLLVIGRPLLWNVRHFLSRRADRSTTPVLRVRDYEVDDEASPRLRGFDGKPISSHGFEPSEEDNGSDDGISSRAVRPHSLMHALLVGPRSLFLYLVACFRRC